MLSKEYLRAFLNEKIYRRALEVYEMGLVFDFEVEDIDDEFRKINSTVISTNGYDEYKVEIEIVDNDYIGYTYCDCPYHDSFGGACKHIGATLIEYTRDYQNRYDRFENGYHKSKGTDANIKSLLRSLQESSSTYFNNKYIIYPELSKGDRGVLNVEFKIGRDDGKKYVLKNISSFVDNINNHSFVKYGKELEFEHNLNAFDKKYHKLINLLADIVDKNDAYCYESYRSYYYGDRVERILALKGRYLDSFFEAIKDIDFSYYQNMGLNGSLREYKLVDGKLDLDIDVQKEENGIRIKTNNIDYFVGHKYLYCLDSNNRQIIRSTKGSNQEEILKILMNNVGKGTFIEKDDFPYFSEFLYPLLCLTGKVKLNDFDPEDYKIEKPTYKFYLDLIDNNILSCKIETVFKDKSYYVNEFIDNITIEDKNIISHIKKYLPYFDGEAYYLCPDDDELYDFLKNGILYFQNLGEVLVSDKLKKINIYSNQKISVGLSVANDLLKLDIVSDTLSNDELFQILNRYDIKKKYYRLKNGQFIELNDDLRNLGELKNSLNLTSKEIESGQISLPKYRAFYLDTLANEVSNNIAKDKSFENLINNLKNLDNEKYLVPENFKEILRPYQVDGFKWLSLLKDNGFGALLADEMGLGKTIQVITLLKTIKNRKRCLVVCPASLVYNWSNEINKFDKTLPCLIIAGNAKEREELINNSKDEILITSYDLLKRDIEYYEDKQFDVEIVDEAQYIKNASTLASKAVKAIRANYKIALTGTPIENRLSEIYSIFEYMMPGFFRSYKYFKENFESPIIKDEDKDVELRLNQMITPFILRRLKKDVLKDLPDKLEEVYYAKLEGEQKQLYDARTLRLKQTLAKTSNEEFKENKLMILAEITRLRQICCDPHIIYEKYKANSAKKDLCIDLINNAIAGGHKVLLFSQFTDVFKELEPLFKENNIKYNLLEGSTPKHKRAMMVESFAYDDTPLFCISLKAGGTGLNLTAADIVIHYDPWWNVAAENQASDRAHRIGQKNIVSVYRLIMKDTIEERILELQNVKTDLANRILSGDKISSSTLSKDDLLKLL